MTAQDCIRFTAATKKETKRETPDATDTRHTNDTATTLDAVAVAQLISALDMGTILQVAK